MPNDVGILRIQIQFCETYLANHTDPADPKNTKEIRDYIEAQLALARRLLATDEAAPRGSNAGTSWRDSAAEETDAMVRETSFRPSRKKP